MVLKRFLKKIQSEENSFQVPRSFQLEERWKTTEKRKDSHILAVLCVTYSWLGIARTRGSKATIVGVASTRCKQIFPATCFSSWIAAKSRLFLS